MKRPIDGFRSRDAFNVLYALRPFIICMTLAPICDALSNTSGEIGKWQLNILYLRNKKKYSNLINFPSFILKRRLHYIIEQKFCVIFAIINILSSYHFIRIINVSCFKTKTNFATNPKALDNKSQNL